MKMRHIRHTLKRKDDHSFLGLNLNESYVTKTPVIEDIRKFLRNDLGKHHRNCPDCGGLLPELRIFYRDVEYDFTCIEITSLEPFGQTGMVMATVLARTDYTKLKERIEKETYEQRKYSPRSSFPSDTIKRDKMLMNKDFVNSLETSTLERFRSNRPHNMSYDLFLNELLNQYSTVKETPKKIKKISF